MPTGLLYAAIMKMWPFSQSLAPLKHSVPIKFNFQIKSLVVSKEHNMNLRQWFKLTYRYGNVIYVHRLVPNVWWFRYVTVDGSIFNLVVSGQWLRLAKQVENS